MAKKIGAEKKREARTLSQAVGAVLTKLRTQQDLSIREVSHRLNYVTNTISAVEMARKSPTLRTLEALAGVYSVKVSTIILAAEKAQRMHHKEGNP